jgi:hypothetical protein
LPHIILVTPMKAQLYHLCKIYLIEVPFGFRQNFPNTKILTKLL